jgi:hypothetical protein
MASKAAIPERCTAAEELTLRAPWISSIGARHPQIVMGIPPPLNRLCRHRCRARDAQAGRQLTTPKANDLVFVSQHKYFYRFT